MKRRNYKFYIRKTHRYLGIFIGIQFLLWTLGGLYFSWTNIKEIRGETLRKEKKNINFRQDFVAPNAVFAEIEKQEKIVEISKIQLIEILDSPFYEINSISGGKEKTFVINALDGKIRENISEDEAKKIAVGSLENPLSVIKETSYLTSENVGAHHEYREKPLPAWAVTFENNLTVYLSAQTGQIGAFRTDKWRVFDFLWMLHTMDFAERDNINNYLLRAFSILGIITIISGFALFFVSSRIFKRKHHPKV